QELVGKERLSLRSKTRKQRGGKHGRGHPGVDGGLQRPASFAGVGNASGEFFQSGVVLQRVGSEIKQPGVNYGAMPPDLGDLSQIRSEEHTSELQSRENLVCRL